MKAKTSMKPRPLISIRLVFVFAAGAWLLQNAASGQTPPLTSGAPILIADSHGKFDFIETDPQTSRLLASHTGNKTLDVFDSVTGAFISHCDTGGAQGVAIDSENGKYYVSVGAEHKVVSIDSKTFAKVGETALPGPADILTYDPKNGLAYVSHDDAAEIWVVDVKASKISGTVPLPAEGPEGILYDKKTDWVFLNIKSANKLVVIDPATNAVVKTWDTMPAASPHGLALDSDAGRLFIAGGNGKLAMIDIPTGKVTASVDIAPKVDQIAMDFQLKRIYCASGTGVMSVVQVKDNPASLEFLGSIPTHKGAHSVAVDAKSHSVWIAYADGDKSYVQKFSPK